MAEPPITAREAEYLREIRRIARERSELRGELEATREALDEKVEQYQIAAPYYSMYYDACRERDSLRLAVQAVEKAIEDERLSDVNRSAMWRNGAKAIVAKVRLALVVAERSSSPVGGTQ